MAVSRNSAPYSLLLSLLVISPALTGCNQSSGFVMNESGKTLYAQGQYTAARREFERALIDRPDSPDYAFNVASAMRKQGDLIGAERMYRHAMTLDPRHQPAHHGLADMFVDQGRVAEADTHLQEWADTQPYLAESHVENAWFLRQQGDTVGAEQSLRRALQVDPKNPVAMAQLGDLYEVSGHPDEARAMYQRSLAGNPYQSEVKARMAGTMQRHSAMPGSQMAGPQMAAYPPHQQMPTMPIQQASYQVPHGYGQPTYRTQMPAQPAPFQGFASTPQPAATQYAPQSPYGSGFTPPPSQMMSSPPPAHHSQYGPGLQAMPYEPPQMQGAMPMTRAPQFNADPAHVPMTMTSVPVVSPF